jgi:hypothetical protein
MPMEKEYCTSCSQTTWHNPSGKKEGRPRCTYCGSPITSNPGKREYQEMMRTKQVKKVRLA